MLGVGFLVCLKVSQNSRKPCINIMLAAVIACGRNSKGQRCTGQNPEWSRLGSQCPLSVGGADNGHVTALQQKPQEMLNPFLIAVVQWQRHS
jgi:hypothetical protein